MKHYKVALIIGRFQPLHKGHIYLIKKGLEMADFLIIGIGSANVINDDNPFTVHEREIELKAMLIKEKLANKILNIIQLDDHPNDADWLQEVIHKASSNPLSAQFDVVIGNNDWVKKIFTEAGFPVEEVAYYKRHIYEGRKIRERLRRENKL